MEINLTTLNAQAISSTAERKKMRMSNEAQAIVFQMFTKNIYSNPIGTIVREITSNCFDSHVEAGVNSPVVIRKSYDKVANTHYISFIDYGVGMSPDRVENIYSVYFESSKRADNEQIGGWGIGGKTPLAYKRSTGFGEGEYDNSFNIITNYNGVKYCYCVFEGEDSPGITELYSAPTEEGNGTEVRIPVLEKDINTFKREMVRQLYYFENIIFENFTDDLENTTETEEILTNEFQIVRANTFLFRSKEYSPYVHVCLGRVAYPLDYNVLGLNSSDYKFPVAIRLEIGEVTVTPSRETLNYSEGTIKVLKTKIELVKEEIKGLLTKQYENIVTLEDYFQVKNNFGMLSFPNGEGFNVGDIIKQKDVDFSNFKYSFLKMPNDKVLFKLFFDTKLYGKKPTKKRRRLKYASDSEVETEFVGGYDKLVGNKILDGNNANANVIFGNVLFIENDFQKKLVKQAWLKYKYKTFYVVSKNKIFNKYEAKTVSDIFNVHDSIVQRNPDGTTVLDANSNPIPTLFMKGLLDLQEEYFEIVRKYCADYNRVEVPQDYIESRKLNAKKLSLEFRNTTIPVKLSAKCSSTYRVKLDSLFRLNIKIFYGTKEEEDALLRARKIFEVLFDSELVVSYYQSHDDKFKLKGSNNKKGVLFMRVSQGNIKYMKYCRNAHPIADFKDKMLKRKEKAVIDYFQALNFIQKYNSLDSLYRSKEFSKLCPVWGKKINNLNVYIKKQRVGNLNYWANYRYELGRYFNLTNIQTTAEQDKFALTVEELREMEELNKDVMNYIDMPNNFENASDIFWNLLRKILVY